jgi:hypothetical protein
MHEFKNKGNAMRFTSILFLLFYSQFASAGINWIILKGFNLDTTERNKVIKLSNELGILNIYEIKAGQISHFYDDKGIIVKGIEFTGDTIQKEKWLYIWKNKTKHSGHFYQKYCDSTLLDAPFTTGLKNIAIEYRHVYRYGSQVKAFNLENGNYKEVKFILDCILNGTAIEDSMEFKKETENIWKNIKLNLLKFINVHKWMKSYRFGYCLSDSICFKPESANTENTDAAMEAIVVNKSCRILYGGPGAGMK